ncbi:NUDIX hydrolase [Streptomyces sp. NPDC020883]|uniref:NUDIX hydrolase n=1 Tax=Streptomyces sp. NPDC020883 TaxID=3365099 RepID=UPI0037AA353B
MHIDTTGGEPAAGCEAVAVIINRCGHLLMHQRDDLPEIAWPAHWRLLQEGRGEGAVPAGAVIGELGEAAGFVLEGPMDLFEIRELLGSGRPVTFFAATWDGDETGLLLAEGDTLRFFAPDHLSTVTIPPFIRAGLHRHLTLQPA